MRRGLTIACFGLAFCSFCLVPGILLLAGVRITDNGLMWFGMGGVFFALAPVLLVKGRKGPAYTCDACGYDLRGIESDMCPECGAERGDEA